MNITEIEILWAEDADVERGLIGWVRCFVDDLLDVQGIALRRTLDGRFTLSWPVREDRHGNRHWIMQPIDDAARKALEGLILAAMDTSERARVHELVKS